MGEYSKASIIKFTREALGMTQEELAETICEPETLSRYENGILDPTDEKFVRLMNKMGEKGDIFLFPLGGTILDMENAMDKMRYALERKDWNAVIDIRSEIQEKGNLSLEYPEISQYIKRIDIIMSYEKRKWI